MSALTIWCDLSGLDSLIDEMGSSVQEAVRPAAQAAAQVLYDDALSRVERIGSVTGNLRSALYQGYATHESTPDCAVYNVTWNHKKAPHAILVEYGHIQRYATYLGKDGRWHTAIRPSMRGKPKPHRRASQAVKDAYYVTLPTPVQVPAKPFIRPAASKFNAAMEAAKAELYRHMDKRS